VNRLRTFTARHWIAGTALALLGVAVARVSGDPVAVSVGRLVSFAGLGWIAWGIHRRTRIPNDSSSSTP
jgi:VIT1/CCC1 family predicted Fe2+/Mn2+ transporter